MNKHVSIAFVATASLVVAPSVNAFDPVTIAVGAAASAGISKAIDGLVYLTSSSKSDQDYAAQHERLQFFTKKDFIDDITFALRITKQSALDFITQHELYRYPPFIEAIKELFPEYAQYIKALMQALEDNPKLRLVRGFETDHLYHKGAGLFKKNARDFSEFYELIKKLCAEVLAQEQADATQSEEPQSTAADADEVKLSHV